MRVALYPWSLGAAQPSLQQIRPESDDSREDDKAKNYRRAFGRHINASNPKSRKWDREKNSACEVYSDEINDPLRQSDHCSPLYSAASKSDSANQTDKCAVAVWIFQQRGVDVNFLRPKSRR
jgi:hypothetical protein